MAHDGNQALDESETWMAWIAQEWNDDLADSRQDIYSLTDGVPVTDPGQRLGS